MVNIEKKTLRIATMEAFGVFCLCFFGGLSIISYTEDSSNTSYSPQLAIALIHGIILYIAISLAAPISGGHINPAVSLALFFTYRLEKSELFLYIASQTIGSVLAGIMLAVVRTELQGGGISDYEKWKGMGLGEPNLNYFILENGQLKTVIIPFIYEFLGTFVLVFTVFALGVDQKLSGEVVGKGVGAVVVVMALSIGKEFVLIFKGNILVVR